LREGEEFRNLKMV